MSPSIIADPKYHDLLSVIKGFRNGLVYGTKIRFPHALVMTFLFKQGPFHEKLMFILKATKQHAWNLSRFVVIYKSILLLLNHTHHEYKRNAFIAGTIGGYYIFGANNNINQQIVLYLFSRIMMGLAKLSVKKNLVQLHNETDPFPVFASLVWGTVMYLFRHYPDTLQPSLQASMQYLYNDSNMWHNLKTLIWHNK